MALCARADLGLLIVEHSFVTKRGRTSLTQLGVDSDISIPGLKRLVDAVHGNETPIVLQINHGGSTTSTGIMGSQPVAPSSIMHPRRGKEMPHALTSDEIGGIVDCFRDAAIRAANAGFDAARAHFYFSPSFLSNHPYLL